MRKLISTGEVQRLEFTADHFREAQMAPAPLAGMPLLESFELINKWNRAQHQPQFVYYLEA